MDIKEVFRITRVPDTVINQEQIEAGIEARCGDIRRTLLDACPVLDIYADEIYVRYGETIKGQTPCFAVIVGSCYVLLFQSVLEGKGNFRKAIGLAGPALYRQNRSLSSAAVA